MRGFACGSASFLLLLSVLVLAAPATETRVERPPRIKGVGLGDVADLGVDAASWRALVADLAARGRQQTGDGVEQPGLPAPARTHDRQKLSGADIVAKPAIAWMTRPRVAK